MPFEPTNNELKVAIDRLKQPTESSLENFQESINQLIAKQEMVTATVNQLVADRDRQVELVGSLLDQVEVLQARLGDVPPQKVN